MAEFFDYLARQVARPMPRRQMLGIIASAIAGSLSGKLSVRAQSGECDPENDPIYPHPCGDICCRYDYTCSSSTLLNGGDTQGICCPTESESKLCSNGTHGWCCPGSGDRPQTACGTEPFECLCPVGEESCGSGACCPADSFCCDPNQQLCCPKDGVCCYDQFERGSCCEEGTQCVPVSATGEPAGRICCADKQACIGQCCPPDETCVLGNDQDGYLMCCPDARATPDRQGCCNPGFVALSTGNCCVETAYCNGDCCGGGTACIDGECRTCPEGQDACAGVCCDPGTCCFGTCCPDNSCCFGKCCSGPDFVCTGECTKLEEVTGELSPTQDLLLESTDGETVQAQNSEALAAAPSFNVYLPANSVTEPVTVTYTSQAEPTRQLPAEYQLLRSFQLQAHRGDQTTVTQLQAVFYMSISYTVVTLAAMGVETEENLELLYWDGTRWIHLLPCTGCGVHRSIQRVALQSKQLGEFALVAKLETLQIYLPLITR